MLRLFSRLLLFGLLVLPLIFSISGSGQMVALAADEDPADGEDDDEGQVENEDAEATLPKDSVTLQGGDEEDDDEEEKQSKTSPDADAVFVFTKPTTSDLPAGSVVEFLVGFTNKGSGDFVLDTLDASFRYPMDFSYYIQNFSTIQYNRVVKPSQQVTLAYSFMPNEAFSARPFGLTVNLVYHDETGASFVDAVFNETINIIELEEGLDGETVFLYIFLIACAALLVVGGQQFFHSFTRKKSGGKSKESHSAAEVNSRKNNEVDYDWLPKELLQSLNKSPRKSPKNSPRGRVAKTNRGKGSDDK